MYGMMYGVKRTTIYLPDEMKTAIEREAARRGVTEAEVIRGAVEKELEDRPKLRRRIFPIFSEGLGEDIAGRVDELLEGMGEDGMEDW
jgi:predicted transcriptional regulator